MFRKSVLTFVLLVCIISAFPSFSNQSVYAGHMVTGNGQIVQCTCGCPKCICDPGEDPEECGNSMVAQPPDKGQPPPAVDYGSLALVLGVLLALKLASRS